MNISETAAVLAKIRLIDNREVNELVIREWHDAIGHLAYADAIEAVREHRRTSTDYLQPAHLTGLAAQARPAQTVKPISDASHYCHTHWLPKIADSKCERCMEAVA